jgi:hypothetical protein
MKKQTRKVGVAGGFINQMMGNNSTEPKVGDGATILMYSDREAYEVIFVSECGSKCTLRKVDTKWCGLSYGDEKYEYKSNPENYTIQLEWSDKKGCWGKVTYSIEIIKSLVNKYHKKYGWGWADEMLKDFGIESYQHLYVDPSDDNHYDQMKLIDGVTKKYKNFNKASVIFGIMQEYRDPHF